MGISHGRKATMGGYTAANAAEFLDRMEGRMGWSSCGDKQYVPHVRRKHSAENGLGGLISLDEYGRMQRSVWVN